MTDGSNAALEDGHAINTVKRAARALGIVLDEQALADCRESEAVDSDRCVGGAREGGPDARHAIVVSQTAGVSRRGCGCVDGDGWIDARDPIRDGQVR